MSFVTLLLLSLVAAPLGDVAVVLRTELGEIEMVLFARRAPGTAANFLRYVDAGHYDGGRFHRTVRLDNQPGKAVPPVRILSARRKE